MEPKQEVVVKYFTIAVEGIVLKFNSSGHCEQVLRGLVHSGYVVTIKEVTEIRQVTSEEIQKYYAEGVNFNYIDSPKKLSRNYDNECAETMPTLNACR